MKRLIAGFAFAAAMTGAAWGGEVEVRTLAKGARPPAAAIEDIAWLAGRWVGEGLGGVSEEVIAPPMAGQMMGMFRQTKADGSLMFYEFYQFAEEAGSLVLRIKHFNPDFTGWEEKDGYVEFPLVAAEHGAVYFDGLTFALDGENGLRAAVTIGEEGRADFRYERTPSFEQ